MDPIEVEVVEIDGKTPPPQSAPDLAAGESLRTAGSWQDSGDDTNSGGPFSGSEPWRQWPGTVRTLHPAWWPVILVLGTVLLVLALTVGVVIAVIYLLLRTLFRFLHALFR